MNLTEEYKTLREEIGRLQDQVSRGLEFGILATSGILAFSLTTVVGEDFRWFVLFTPCIFLIPFVYLTLQSVRTTWIIGRYIELGLEEELGLFWERFNRRFRGSRNSKFRSRFAESSAAPLLVIQLVCPFISLAVGPNDYFLWTIFTLTIIAVVFIEIVFLRRFTPTDEMVEEIDKEIRSVKGLKVGNAK